MPRQLSFSILVLLFIIFSYIALSVGLIERILFMPNRLSIVHQLGLAAQSTPPNAEYLFEKINSPDWFVVSIALHHLEALEESNMLSEDQSNQALAIIFDNLGERGHWWRFGWDKEETEFNQFYSQVISTASSFGPDLLPWLQTLAQDKNPLRREAVCRIVAQLPDNENIENKIFLDETRSIVQKLVVSDSSSLVISTCNQALRNLP